MLGNRIHPIEGVVGTIEVKTEAKASTLREGVMSVASVKRLMPKNYKAGWSTEQLDAIDNDRQSSHPFGAIFCYTRSRNSKKTPISTKSLVTSFSKACGDVEVPHRADTLFVLDEFCTQWNSDNRWDLLPLDKTPQLPSGLLWYTTDSPEDVMLLFYHVVVSGLQHYEPPPLNLGDYFTYSGIEFSYDYAEMPR
jgi:hypothetical protein